ncbi:MAG: hypothetical protein JWO24_2735 [Rhodospirillales bacterium]|jgi:Flp pilus assembly protein TadG|nr:hypothetical protein [Rhodospirillales bacterium]
MRRWISRLAGFAALNRRGVAAVEFAVIAPVLIILLAGAANVGLAVDHTIQLSNAARAGAQYAIANQNDLTGAATAALAALPGSNPPPTAIMTCTCPPSGQSTGGTAVGCTTTCATGMARYVTVTVTMAPPQIAGLAFNVATGSRTVVARVQ